MAKRTYTIYPSSYIQASSIFSTPNGGKMPYTRYYGLSGFQKLHIPENRYVIDVKYFHQYAEGITGQTFNRRIYAIPDGFRTKAEARQFAKLHDLKSYKKKGRGNRGYGDVGARTCTVDIVPAGLVRNPGSAYELWIDEVYLFDSINEEGDING